MRKTLSIVGAALLLGAGCDSGSRRPDLVGTCQALTPADLGEVGEILTVAPFLDGYIVAGTRDSTMRVATIDGQGAVAPAAAIGALPEVVSTTTPLRAAFRVEGATWTLVFPDADALVGYSVDTMTGDGSRVVYANHFTNSEPVVLWMPTAFWFGPSETANFGMQRVEISSGSEGGAPWIWLNSFTTVELMPDVTAGPPLLALDGAATLALGGAGLVSYANGVVADVEGYALATGVATLRVAVPWDDGFVAAGTDGDGGPALVRVAAGGTVRTSYPDEAGLPVAVAPVGERGVAWVDADATLRWLFWDGEAAGAPVPAPGATAPAAPGPDLVQTTAADGATTFAYTYADAGQYWLARQRCEATPAP